MLDQIGRAQKIRLLLALVGICALVFAAEYIYGIIHLRSGKHGWFAVDEYVNAYRISAEDAPGYVERVLGGPFESKAKCAEWSLTMSRAYSVLCKNMRYDDAAQDGWNGTVHT